MRFRINPHGALAARVIDAIFRIRLCIFSRRTTSYFIKLFTLISFRNGYFLYSCCFSYDLFVAFTESTRCPGCPFRRLGRAAVPQIDKSLPVLRNVSANALAAGIYIHRYIYIYTLIHTNMLVHTCIHIH